MPVTYGRFAASTGGGTQTITNQVGEAIKGVIVFGVKLAAEGYGAGYAFSVGAADAAGNAWHLAGGSDDNAATSNTYSYGGTGDLGRHLTAEATYDCIFDIGTFETDGDFTIVWSDAPSSAWVFHYLAFWGSDVHNCAARTVNNSTSSGNQAITGVGFQGTWGFSTVAVQTAGSNATVRLTMGQFASSTQRGMIGLVDADNQADATVGIGQRTDRMNGFASSGGTWTNLADFVSWDADGLTITWDAANASARPMHFFIVDIDDVWVGSFNADTGGAAQDITGPGFEASGFLAFSRDQTAASTIDNSSANAAKVSLFAGDADDSGGIWISEDDGAATMEANMRTRHGISMAFSSWPSTTDGEATFTPVSDGLDVTWSDAPPRASEIILSVFGTGVTEHFGATASTYTFGKAVAGFATKTGATASTYTFGKAVAGFATKGGATASTWTFTKAVAGVRVRFGATASTYTLGKAVAGFATKAGATASTVTFVKAVAGFATKAGAAAAPFTFGKAVAGARVVFGSTSLPVTFDAAAAGDVSTGPTEHFGASASTWALGAATSGFATKTGTTASTYTFGKAVAGVRVRFGSTVSAYTFGKAVASTRTTFGATSLPTTFGASTSAVLEAFGVVSMPIVVSITTRGPEDPAPIPRTVGGLRATWLSRGSHRRRIGRRR